MAMQRVLARLSPLLVVSDHKYIPSFSSTLVADPSQPAKETTWTNLLSAVKLKELESTLFTDKRVVFFGEQHQQSKVLRAQMLILNALHQSTVRRNKKLVIVLEHFNFEQDELLGRFSDASITDEELMTEYAKSKEGFDLVHYLPLLTLARELGVRVHGGFPPRQWASLVYKESLSALRASREVQIPTTFEDSRWSQITDIGPEQVAYLESMMSGRAPTLPDPNELPSRGYQSGILAAQTLKDTFFAWSIDRHLSDSDTVVYAVCGLGHCEYGICASSRLRGCSASEIFIVASKEWESSEWRGEMPEYTETDKLADLVVPYNADEVAIANHKNEPQRT